MHIRNFQIVISAILPQLAGTRYSSYYQGGVPGTMVPVHSHATTPVVKFFQFSGLVIKAKTCCAMYPVNQVPLPMYQRLRRRAVKRKRISDDGLSSRALIRQIPEDNLCDAMLNNVHCARMSNVPCIMHLQGIHSVNNITHYMRREYQVPGSPERFGMCKPSLHARRSNSNN